MVKLKQTCMLELIVSTKINTPQDKLLVKRITKWLNDIANEGKV